MKRRNRRFECVYAGPPMPQNDKKNDGSEAEAGAKKPYPECFFEDEPAPNEPAMLCVYAGPDMMSSRAKKAKEPLMQAVYACPPVRAELGAEMNEVYAGPDMFCDREERTPIFCPKCGFKCAKSANFCSNCGASLKPDKQQKRRRGFFARPKGNRDELV